MSVEKCRTEKQSTATDDVQNTSDLNIQYVFSYYRYILGLPCQVCVRC